ncbi:MAG: UMP kinase [Alphaproteobacteria bacterium]
MPIPHSRVLLKISGEALAPPEPLSSPHGIDPAMLEKLGLDIKNVHDSQIEICIVIGGGNIFRGDSGSETHGIDRATSDYMGMLATVINALALQSALEALDVPCRVMTAIPMPTIGEPYIRRRAIRHLEKKRVVIFAAGTGNPFFTTDTAAALRASEMGCDLLLKATKVDGVYSDDPTKNAQAVFYPTLNYHDVLFNGLNIMDATAVALARENHVPIAVFSIYDTNGFSNVLKKQGRFTLIRPSVDE